MATLTDTETGRHSAPVASLLQLKHAGLAMLGLSGQLALEDMMESYLAEEQLTVRCSVVLELVTLQLATYSCCSLDLFAYGLSTSSFHMGF